MRFQSSRSFLERLESRKLLSTLDYSTFLGGSTTDGAFAVAVDAAGNTYVTGSTGSDDFPVSAGAFDTSQNGVYDAFVVKFRPDGTRAWATFLGGDGDERGHGIAVDSGGNAYVIGRTDSADFPTTQGSMDTTLSGEVDAFVTKLNADGNALVYSTYLGGTGLEIDQGFDKLARRIGGIVVDSTGQAYVTGSTTSADFPTTVGAFDTIGPGFIDAFVTKLNAAGSALVYSTYLGGDDVERGHDIAIDAVGNAYLTGEVWSINFPTTPGSFQPTPVGGGGDNYVTKLNPTGSALVYSGYLGGTGTEFPGRIAVDSTGQAYVTGATASFDFPTTTGAFQPAKAVNGFDGTVTKINAAGSAMVYSTHLGGGFGHDYGEDIAVDSSGQAYVTGFTASPGFPVANAFQPDRSGVSDSFVTKLNGSGTALVFSSYLGGGNGSGTESGFGIAIDANHAAHVVGQTNTAGFPETPDAFQPAFGGGANDAYFAKIAFDQIAPTVSSSEFGFDTAPQSIRITFSEDVSDSLSVQDLLLENLTTGQSIPSANLSVSYDHGTNTAIFTFPGYSYGALPDGTYRATLLASGVTDPAGNSLPANHVLNFFFRQGDADHNNIVDFDDYVLIDNGFNNGLTGFTNGDFNYDGVIDFDDYVIIDVAFNTQ